MVCLALWGILTSVFIIAAFLPFHDDFTKNLIRAYSYYEIIGVDSAGMIGKNDLQLRNLLQIAAKQMDRFALITTLQWLSYFQGTALAEAQPPIPRQYTQ